jgi:preprotein translocase subunit YajC
MSAQSGLGQFLPLVIVIAVAWFLIIRPGQKRAKEQAELLSSLEVGTEIVTIGGIYGRIVKDGDDRLLIEVADGSRLQIARKAVGRVVPASDTQEADDDDEALPEADETVADDDSGDNA